MDPVLKVQGTSEVHCGGSLIWRSVEQGEEGDAPLPMPSPGVPGPEVSSIGSGECSLEALRTPGKNQQSVVADEAYLALALEIELKFPNKRRGKDHWLKGNPYSTCVVFVLFEIDACVF